MSAAVFCSRCGTWRELYAPCACVRPQPAPSSDSNFRRVVEVAAAITGERLRKSGGPFAVTESEMNEASVIARSEVEA